MRVLVCCFLLLGVGALAKERVKRQSYTFPGPRSDRSHRAQLTAAPVYVEEQDEGEVYPAPRRFQGQPVQPQYAPAQARSHAPSAPPPPPSAPVYEAAPAPRQAAPAPRSQSSARRRASSSSSSSSRANKYGSAPQQSLNGHDEEEEEQVPDPLSLLLQDSQFTCGGKQDGYYADDSVNCQVFHYCVGGAKHSWMCPENTVFHQVHLNCVPDAQDICSQSQKFHFVNEYLYKPVDYDGPNNTARYSQRYYPDGYSVGDALVAPNEHAARRPAAQPQSYPAPAPAPRQQPRQPAPAPPPPPPPQPTYRAPSQPASYNPPVQSRPASRPSRPLESYPVEAPPSYRSPPPSQPAASYRGGQPQQQVAPQPQQAYRGAAAPQQAAAPPQPYRSSGAQPSAPSREATYSSDENLYQPQPAPQSRSRSSSSSSSQPRQQASYAPPRQQYRQTSGRSAAGYQPYASNQAAGVQYDEDY